MFNTVEESGKDGLDVKTRCRL